MKSLLISIGKLAILVFLAALVATKLSDQFPAMTTTAWLVVVAGFGAWIYLALRLDGWIERLWPGRFSEDQLQWITVLAVFVFTGIVMVLGWGVLGPLLAPQFGAAVR
jgi:amino acid permease